MFKIGKKATSVAPDTIRIHTLISDQAVFEGNIRLSGNIKIDGKLVGNCITDSDFIASETSVITGDITIQNALVAGTLSGNVKAGGQVSIKAEASVKGDVDAAGFLVEEGATYSGQCRIGKPKAQDNSGDKQDKADKQPK